MLGWRKLAKKKAFLIFEFEKLENWEKEETKKRKKEVENTRENPEVYEVMESIKSLRNPCGREYNKVLKTFGELEASLKKAFTERFEDLITGKVDMDKGSREILLGREIYSNMLEEIEAKNIAFQKSHFERLVGLYMELDNLLEIDPEEKEARVISFEEERIRREEDLEKEKERMEDLDRDAQKQLCMENKDSTSNNMRILYYIGIGMTPLLIGILFSLFFGCKMELLVGFLSFRLKLAC